VAVAARPVRVLHAVAHRPHDVAAHRAADVAMANSVAIPRVLKATATTAHAQKAALTTEATTVPHAKAHPAVSVARVAMATNCRATSTL